MKPRAAALRRFLYYVLEREHIRIRKEVDKKPWPWTENEILRTYKFTNVRRINDRTTRHFLALYQRMAKSRDLVALYNCAVRRYYGTMAFSDEVGWLPQHDKRRLVGAARRLFARGEHVFTGAYIITNAGISQPKEVTVADYLRGLWVALPGIMAVAREQNTWEAVTAAMREVTGFGGSGFMTKEVLQDYILWMDVAGKKAFTDALTWTPVGPGARRGLNRLFGRDVKFKQKEELFYAEIVVLREQAQMRWAKEFGKRAGTLSAHDIQFCLCEFDKMERVRLGQGRPRSIYRPPMIATKDLKKIGSVSEEQLEQDKEAFYAYVAKKGAVVARPRR